MKKKKKTISYILFIYFIIKEVNNSIYNIIFFVKIGKPALGRLSWLCLASVSFDKAVVVIGR